MFRFALLFGYITWEVVIDVLNACVLNKCVQGNNRYHWHILI